MITSLTEAELEQLTPAELRKYQILLRRDLAKRSPLDLAEIMDPRTRRWTHIELLNEHLVALVEYRLYVDGPGPEADWFYVLDDRENGLETHPALSPAHIPMDDNRLIEVYGQHPTDSDKRVIFQLAIAMPPRHGKSYLVSEYFPLWYWMRYPDRDWALATYSDEFAASEWGVKMRDKLNDNAEFLGLDLRGAHRASADNQRLEQGGRAKFVGAGGSLTGTGWQLGIIDDPFKNQDDALSEAERRRKKNWYISTWDSRRTGLYGVIPVEVMMFTRWHEDDLSGEYVYNDDGTINDAWCMVHLAALALEDDPIGRRPGDALCPAVKTRVWLENQREKDPTWFASLYQGTPSIGEAGTFGKFRHWTVKDIDGRAHYATDNATIPIDECVRFETVDLAGTVQSYSDYSVISVWDWHKEHQKLFLVGMTRERIESDTHPEWLEEHHDPTAEWMGIESATFGITALQHFRRRGTITVRELHADRDKIARSIPYADGVRGGKVYFPKHAPWLYEWENEHKVFPHGKHDDMVDTGSYAMIEAFKMPASYKRNPPPSTMEERMAAHIERKLKKRSRKQGKYKRAREMMA